MTLGSLFDGIGGWLMAAKHAGIKPIWASEIDDFPAAVTAHHFPQVKQLGDITKIDVDKLEPVDIICAGSPCQDLSVAGKREGLSGERSGLFRTAIKLVHGLRERTGKPRYFVWENVPGAFSSNKGHDFRAVLEEITKTEIPMPKDGRWAESGYMEWGGTSSLAWRTLDAQYWGVPQRRKRIFLVADFGGRTAGEILFVEQGLSGHTSESQREGQEAATDVGTSIDSASGIGLDIYNQRITGDKACTVTTKTGRYADASGPTVLTVYDMTHADEVMRPISNDKMCTLNARMGTGGNQVPIVHFREGTFRQFIQDDLAGTLKATGGVLGGGSETLTYQNRIRRLTPLECEQLQGLPDQWTNIEFNGKSAPDSRRYKALGNGMAQPCADFVIRRIAEVNQND